jgi:hypothetical protein
MPTYCRPHTVTEEEQEEEEKECSSSCTSSSSKENKNKKSKIDGSEQETETETSAIKATLRLLPHLLHWAMEGQSCCLGKDRYKGRGRGRGKGKGSPVLLCTLQGTAGTWRATEKTDKHLT